MTWFHFEGILLFETKGTIYGELTLFLTKQTKGKGMESFVPHIAKLPTPRYIPIYVRETTEAEKVLYGRKEV
jgi:hypothetical protein